VFDETKHYPAEITFYLRAKVCDEAFLFINHFIVNNIKKYFLLVNSEVSFEVNRTVNHKYL